MSWNSKLTLQKKQYQRLDKVFALNKNKETIIKKERSKKEATVKKDIKKFNNQVYTTMVNIILLNLLIKFMNTLIHLLAQKYNRLMWFYY